MVEVRGKEVSYLVLGGIWGGRGQESRSWGLRVVGVREAQGLGNEGGL